jgi:hypothetical protein
MGLMAWYEYTTLKRHYAEITADIQGWLATRRARRDAAIKAVMRAEIQRAEERIAKYMERTIRLLEMTDERQNFRLTVIEKKLDIPTGTHLLAGALEQESASEQDKRLIEALLQPTPQVSLPGHGLLAPSSPKDRAKEKAPANRG